MTPELALLEILSELVVKDILTWDAVEGKMKSKGIDVPFQPSNPLNSAQCQNVTYRMHTKT